MKVATVGNVLIRGANWVGDAVMTIPALREVRRIFAEAHLTLWTKPSLQDLFADSRLVDDILIVPAPSWRASVAAIRAMSFDVAILFQNAFRAAFLVFSARIPLRCGYRTGGRGFLLTHAITVPPELNSRHQVFFYLNLVSSLEAALTGQSRVNFESPDQSLPVTTEQKERGLALLARSGVALDKSLVIVNPGATNSRAKQWLPERFASVADQLVQRAGADVVFIGAREEAELAGRIAAQMRNRPVLLTGETSLRELVEIISCADLLISNDTGPAHIGAAVGVPTVAVFGPTEHYATRPFSERAAVVRQPVSCSPCMLRDCPIDHRCMAAVTVEDVLSRSLELLAGAASGAMPALR
jgi:heptosyltransferase II